MDAQRRVAVILGAADGLTLAISEVASLYRSAPAVVHAGLGAGIGELVGMTAALYAASDGASERLGVSLACGAATLAACFIPCLPYLAWHGLSAIIASLALAVVIAAIICRLRPEKGVLAVVQTYGLLAVAGVACWLASLA